MATPEINRGLRYIKNRDGGFSHGVSMPPVLAVTYHPGNLLCLSWTSGSVRLAAAADTSLYGVVMYTVPTAAAGDMVEVMPFTPNNIFEGRAHGGMSGGKPENYIGHYMDLIIPTATYHRLGTGGSTVVMICVGYNSNDKGLATQGLRYWVVGRSSKSQSLDNDPEH